MVKNLNGKTNFVNFNTQNNGSKIRFADGASLFFTSLGAGSNRSTTNVKPLNVTRGELNIDINGDKGPARLGRDVFIFYITKYGIYPRGMNDDTGGNLSANCSIANSATSMINGASCAAWILQHENMDYLRKNMVCTGSNTTGYDCHLE